MTNEENKTEEIKTCNCSALGKFFTQVVSVFLGALLAILVSAAVLKPQCPCHKGFHKNMPQMERQMPQMEMGMHKKHFKGEYRGVHKKFDKSHFKGDRPDSQPQKLKQEK